jgi:2-methylcitrate dehydratase
MAAGDTTVGPTPTGDRGPPGHRPPAGNEDRGKQGYEGVLESTIKKYNAVIHSQSAIYCMVELAKKRKIDPAEVASIEAEVFRLCYDFAGGGLYGMDRVIRTKEEADHNLPYLLSAALIDGNVTPAQFEPARIARHDVQTLLKKVTTRPSATYTAVYPKKMPVKISVQLQDGTVIENEVQDCPGLASCSFTWGQSAEKFDRLVEGRVDERLCQEIKDAVRSLETIQARDLTALLGRVVGRPDPAPKYTAECLMGRAGRPTIAPAQASVCPPSASDRAETMPSFFAWLGRDGPSP